jgi:hypothetical protein
MMLRPFLEFRWSSHHTRVVISGWSSSTPGWPATSSRFSPSGWAGARDGGPVPTWERIHSGPRLGRPVGQPEAGDVRRRRDRIEPRVQRGGHQHRPEQATGHHVVAPRGLPVHRRHHAVHVHHERPIGGHRLVLPHRADSPTVRGGLGRSKIPWLRPPGRRSDRRVVRLRYVLWVSGPGGAAPDGLSKHDRLVIGAVLEASRARTTVDELLGRAVPWATRNATPPRRSRKDAGRLPELTCPNEMGQRGRVSDGTGRAARLPVRGMPKCPAHSDQTPAPLVCAPREHARVLFVLAGRCMRSAVARAL